MSTTTPLAVRRFTLVALVLPTVLVVAGLIIQLISLRWLPDPIAVHWGVNGAPNGFGPAWLTLALTAVVGLGIPVLIAASVRGPLRRGDRGFSYRLLGATALGLATLMSVLGTATLAMQAGLAVAADGPHIWWALIGSFVAAAIAGVAGWALQPSEPHRVSALPAEHGIELADSERAVWLQRVVIARAGAIILVCALALMVVLTVITAVAAPDPAAMWIMIGATILIVGLVVMTLGFHVRVDENGLWVNSAAGWPRVHIPLAKITKAEAVEVNPMGEFGGWGLRWAPGGGMGVVLRRGPGIRVQRTNGKLFTVTVDDAETGAALLEALRARAGADGAAPRG